MASNEPQVPSFDRLMWPAICALKQMGGSASHHELLNKVIEIAKIPEDAQSVAHTTGRESRVGYNLRWAQSYLGKYGALENTSRGVWALTAKGRRLKESEIKEVVATVRKMNQVKRRSGNGTAEPEGAPESNGGWKDDLIEVVQGMTADGFERLCQRILRESGFLKVEVTGRSSDGESMAWVSCVLRCCHSRCTSNARSGRGTSAPRISATFGARWLAGRIKAYSSPLVPTRPMPKKRRRGTGRRRST